MSAEDLWCPFIIERHRHFTFPHFGTGLRAEENLGAFQGVLFAKQLLSAVDFQCQTPAVLTLSHKDERCKVRNQPVQW